MTLTEKRIVAAHVRREYRQRNPRRVQFDADGRVSVMLDTMPNTSQPGRIFAGNADELLREARQWAQS